MSNDHNRMADIVDVLRKASVELTKITGEEIMVLCGFQSNIEDVKALVQSVHLPESIDFDTASKIYLSLGYELSQIIADRGCDECNDSWR